MTHFLPSEKLGRLYDRIGRFQDTQYFYEKPAMQILLQYGDFFKARAVYEAGCGTGRVARMLLSRILTAECRYVAADISERMVAMAREAVAAWAPRASVVRADVTTLRPEGSFDRVLSLFVVDLFDEKRTFDFLDCAHAVLIHGGLLCIGGLTEGEHGMERFISEAWKRVHDIVPAILGGCRPGTVVPYLDRARWQVLRAEHRCLYGLCSEGIIARKL